ncbi:MAG: DnaA N-terminal domain-containing protein [Solirubrobacteraceae bacterium]
MILVEESYVTARDRKRRRQVQVELDEVRRQLGIPGVADRDDWEQTRSHLRELVGDSTFEIWLQPLELIAIDTAGVLVIAAPAATRGWVEQRFSRVLARCGEQRSRALRLADESECQALARDGRAHSSPVRAVHINQREVS